MEVSGRRDFLSKDKQSDILCQPCHGDGDNVPAEGYCETCNEYFCSTCLKVHKKQSVTKNHVIKGKHEMPKEQVQTDPCSQVCATHTREIVKFYCEAHDEVGCGDCMVLGHKTCNVQLVPEVSCNYGNSKELKNIRLGIEQLEKTVASQKRQLQENVKAAEDIKRKVIKAIKLFRAELNAYLDRAEAEIIKEIEELNAKDVLLQNKSEKECKDMGNFLKELKGNLDKDTEKMNQLFVTAKLASKKLQAFQEFAKRFASEVNVNSYIFQPSKDLRTLVAREPQIGTLSILQKEKKIHEKINRSLVNMEVKFPKTLDAKVAKETRNEYITGMAMISSDEILLTDYNNASIKIMNVRDNKITSRFTPSAHPWDVTVIKQGTVAVTLPGPGKILFMNTLGSLSVSHSLDVRRDCYGIDHRNGIIAVSFTRPPAVQILNMEGRILHELKDTSLLSSPHYIALNIDNKSLFVSDYGTNAVHELTLDGQLIATRKHDSLKSPRGLSVTSDGTVLVCCCDVSDKISLILPHTGEVRSLTIRHVKSPQSLLVCEEQNQLYVSAHMSSRYIGYIKVFDLQYNCMFLQIPCQEIVITSKCLIYSSEDSD